MHIEALRAICLQQQAATETVKWGADLVFSVGGKMFCIAATEGPFVFSVKVPADAFDTWCAQPGVVPAPYLARAGWVQFQHPAALLAAEGRKLLVESYEMVAAKLTKKQKAALGLP